MAEEKVDRRVKRTRGLLRQAMLELLREKRYDEITIEDITERANLGRTTFYLHFQSKDDLLVDHFEDFTAELALDSFSREQLLGQEPQPELVAFLQSVSQDSTMYAAFTRAKDAQIIMGNIRQKMIDNFEASLRVAFPDLTPDPPVDILTRYLVTAQLQMIDWWVTSRNRYSAEELARMLHQLQTTAVRDAFKI